MVILSIWGTVTFTLFILEESFQTAMFGTWPAQDAQRWDLVKTGLTTMRGTVRTMKIVNYSVGWIQPLAFLSYKNFGESAQSYINSLQAKALAHAPDLFVGENVSIRFRPRDIKYLKNGDLILSNNKIGVICKESQRSQKIFHANGYLIEQNGIYLIDIRNL